MSGRVFDVARSIASVERSSERRGFTTGRFARRRCWVASFRTGRISATTGVSKEMNEQPLNPSSLTRQGMDYGETSDVQEVHAAIQREKREPRVGLEPLSIWLVVVYGLALFTGGAYLGRFSGNFSGDSLDIAYIPPKKGGPAAGPGGG